MHVSWITPKWLWISSHQTLQTFVCYAGTFSYPCQMNKNIWQATLFHESSSLQKIYHLVFMFLYITISVNYWREFQDYAWQQHKLYLQETAKYHFVSSSIWLRNINWEVFKIEFSGFKSLFQNSKCILSWKSFSQRKMVELYSSNILN